MKNAVLFNLALLAFILSPCAKVAARKELPLLRFGLVADIQYADCEPQGNRYYRNSLKKLDECVAYLNESKVNFTINLGDASDRKFSDLDSVIVRLKRLKKKVYNTTGNHDYGGVADNETLYDKLDMPSEYYSFRKRNWVFVMLNTNEVSSYSNVAGTPKQQEFADMMNRIASSGGTNGKAWNGGVGSRQLEWLDKVLTKAQRKGRRVLVFTHHPMLPENWLSALNGQEILDVIGKYSCVKAVFSGHDHEGNFAVYKDIPLVTFEGMLDTADENAFGIVELYKNKIVVKGRGRGRSRELAVSD
jgi:3',5'-cyclic AMP phosphodiesterase CpdA